MYVFVCFGSTLCTLSTRTHAAYLTCVNAIVVAFQEPVECSESEINLRIPFPVRVTLACSHQSISCQVTQLMYVHITMLLFFLCCRCVHVCVDMEPGFAGVQASVAGSYGLRPLPAV